MIRVSKLIEELKKCPQDAMCYAYEGEVTGVIVYGFGYIPAYEHWNHDQKDSTPVESEDCKLVMD